MKIDLKNYSLEDFHRAADLARRAPQGKRLMRKREQAVCAANRFLHKRVSYTGSRQRYKLRRWCLVVRKCENRLMHMKDAYLRKA